MGLFISYSSLDTGAIEPLRSALRRAHQQVWMDEDLGGGDAWWRTILEQIRNCEVFIVALSNNSLASKPCQAELSYAQALERPILPVQIGPVTSLRVTPFAATQIIDYRNPTAEAGIELIGGVQVQRAQLQPLPSELPEEPPVPFAYLMRLAHNISQPQLSAREQADLVSELKSGLEEDGDDPAARNDIKQLLCMLRDRPDVAYRVRTDIESLLASVDSRSSTVSAGGVAAQDQDFENRWSQQTQPARSAQPWPVSGPTPQIQPAMNTHAVTPPPGTGPQPIVGPPPTGPYAAPYVNAESGKARRSRAKWLVAGGVGVAIVVAAVAVALVAGSGPTPPSRQTTAPTMAPERLESMLLTSAQINTIMGASKMRAGEPGQAPAAPTAKLSKPECDGALYPGETPTYDGSGYTKLNYSVLAEPGDNHDHFVDQDVAAFPSADLADAFVKTSAGQWNSCAGQNVTVTYDNGNTYRWTLGNLIGDPPKISQLGTQEDGSGWACQHVLSAVSNVVIDVRACGFHITDEGSRIADGITANVTR
jgi:serine/threonine kinase PknH